MTSPLHTKQLRRVILNIDLSHGNLTYIIALLDGRFNCVITLIGIYLNFNYSNTELNANRWRTEENLLTRSCFNAIDSQPRQDSVEQSTN